MLRITARVKDNQPCTPPDQDEMIILSGRYAWFLCPCGCKKDCFLRLNGFTETEGLPSFERPLKWTEGCLSHFKITRGEITWLNV